MNARLPACLVATVLLAGCETIQTSQQRQMEMARQQNVAMAAEDRLRRIEGRLETSEMERTQLQQNVQSLQQQVAQLDSNLQSLQAKQAQDMQRVVDQVSGRVATLINKQAASAPQPKSAGRGPGYEHVVEQRQTLSAIAKAYGTSVQAIKEANNLKSDSIYVGQKLFIPDSQ